ncbi:MAG: DUF5107 domain-containing protein [Planctomycetes bacterium]|nr:DUF5107 domain-containing protein [Planctomycetota bacterium]
MCDLRIETFTMPAAELGPENPLPPLGKARDVHALASAPGVPPEIAQNMRYGHLPGILPYTIQDGYDRRRRPKGFKVAVLENDILRATFLLELGGRLWSLFHKPSGRELLACNPVFQPANLALRNAWFSGGVEWNIGTIGHSPFTCSPVFAARVLGPGGAPVLRLYEWERMRQVPFQLDAYLPDASSVLLVRVRIRNPHDHDLPMYWWSNIAVRESPDKRVIVPATSAYRFGYQGKVDLVPVPEFDGTDRTYTTRSKRSTDYFFHIPDGQRPWIAALDHDGKGLVQTSTARLKGRKLFLWGTGAGGARWQEFLSQPGFAYLEIQAGLARTQLEHVRMPAKADWSWLEAYGLMETDPRAVHAADWAAARQAVETPLEGLIPRVWLDAEHDRGATWADNAPVEILHRGSGWGALERHRRAAAGQPAFCSPELAFGDETRGEEQRPWLALLRTGRFPDADPARPPNGFMVQAEWRELLEKSVAGDPSNWFAWLHLGVMRLYAGEHEAARAAWEKSNALKPTAWALRNLAALAAFQNQPEASADLHLAAHKLNPSLRPLTIETCRALLKVKRPNECLDLIAGLPAADRANGRIRYLESLAALDCGDFDRVERLFADGIEVIDLHEGEKSLDEFWFTFHERRLSAQEGVPLDDALRARVRKEFPLPRQYDFRMSEQ